MKISVIVPAYNCAPYLCACVDSIVQQTYTNLEIILINDGSTDDSGSICDACAAADSRIRVIHQQNQGVSAARNTGLDAATGDLIAFVDGDDTIAPDMYETLVALLIDHNADIAHCGYTKVHFDGSVTAVRGTEILLVHSSEQASEALLSARYFAGSTWSKLYKRELFNGLRFNTEMKINEDVVINIHLFKKAKIVVFRDTPKYFYYERCSSATRITHPVTVRKDLLTASEEMLRVHKGTGLESICAKKIHYALLDLYRAYLTTNLSGSKAQRSQLHQQIKSLTQKYDMNSSRDVWNYRFMRCFPRLYMLTYRIYQMIRTPNYDI